MKEDCKKQHYIEKDHEHAFYNLHILTWIQNHMLKVALSLGVSKTR